MPLVELLVPIAPGELIDKITILQIKSERIEDAEKLENVRTELGFLSDISEKKLPATDELSRLSSDLKAVNERIWDLEDEIRDFERNKQFDAAFEKAARSIYKTNDERAALKKEINIFLGSNIVEEKSYTDY